MTRKIMVRTVNSVSKHLVRHGFSGAAVRFELRAPENCGH